MVCLPCIVIPAFLFIWHKFLQPIFLRLWNPWRKLEDKPEETPETDDSKKSAEEPSGGTGKCPIGSFTKSNIATNGTTIVGASDADHSKID